MNDEDKPDYGDLVNDGIVDDIAEVMDTLEWCYEQLSRVAWYNLIKVSDPQAARYLIKFFFLTREEWLDYGRSADKVGVFGLVREKHKVFDDRGQEIDLDQIPF